MTDPVLNETSLVGTWCAFTDYSVGYLVNDEFVFNEDKSFTWKSLEFYDRDQQFRMKQRLGHWALEGDLLKLEITSHDNFEHPPFCRIHFCIDVRQAFDLRHVGCRQLVLKSVFIDDESNNGVFEYASFPVEATAGEAERNHAEVRAQQAIKRSISGPFADLVKALSKTIPAMVADLELSEPLFCIRLFYYDTHAPRDGYCVGIRCLGESVRKSVLSTNRKIDVPYLLWHPTAGVSESPRDGIVDVNLSRQSEVLGICERIYSLLEEAEEDNICNLRDALRSVATKLLIQLPKSIPKTDDFVIFPADGSNFFGGDYEDDMKACIPAKRIELLTQRGYL